MKSRLNIFLSPAFILALALLLINDYFLKFYFHNSLTGKLSDFAGLFIFPLFWSVVFYKRRNLIYFATVLFFVFWKSQYSNYAILVFNSFGFYKLYRTVDLSDLLALVIVPVSYYYLYNFCIRLQTKSSFSNKSEIDSREKNRFYRIAIYPVALLTIFSFCATSYVKTIDYNKKYSFGFNEKVLVKKFNQLQNDCKNTPISEKIAGTDTIIIQGNDTNYYSYNGFTEYFDTIFKYDKILKKPTSVIDTIYHYKFPNFDTIYVKNNKQISFRIPASKYFKNKQSYCDCVNCYMQISWKNDSSFLFLKYIYTSNCYGMFNKMDKKEEKKTLLEAFEKEIINNLKK